jgi:hypothetical protein
VSGSNIGPPPPERLSSQQCSNQRTLELDFYQNYQAYRLHLFEVLGRSNPQLSEQGRLESLVGLTQTLLDRFLFVLYCQEMGAPMGLSPCFLRDLLVDLAGSKDYDAAGGQAWDRMREFFALMGEGGSLGADRIESFSGDLFAENPELDGLRIPNSVFCSRAQAESATCLLASPQTLLFFSAKYRYGVSDDGSGKTLTLTALGRIFEQSLVDLEILEARAAGRPSLSAMTRRKRNGIFYTPEWVTRTLIEQTLGERLAEIREELGFERIGWITDAQIAEYRQDGLQASEVQAYLGALHTYSERLNALKVLDPACGAGAFLLEALQFLCEQRRWVASELERVTGRTGLFDAHEAMDAALAHNLYGVDIHAEAVEFTRLVLRLCILHSDRPLSAPAPHLRCGNALVSTDFSEQLGRRPGEFTSQQLDCVHPFDWHRAFPEVFDRESPGFDCVIGNPPFVKLQNFRHVMEGVSEYLRSAKKADGSPLYASTQSGHFDLYLPFIERGVSLLSGEGKLGYIAPGRWLLSAYGAGLRRFVKQSRSLDRWIDFKSYQVFEHATTYTALQFFSGKKTDRVRCSFAPQGPEDVAAVNWAEPSAAIEIDGLEADRAWVLMPETEAQLWDKIRAASTPLEDACAHISVGVQTSADRIYHLEKLGPGRYRSRADGRAHPVDIQIEDAIMRPLVSGREARRYQCPQTDIYILFPYRISGDRAELIPDAVMGRQYPNAWCYLRSHEEALRQRERGKMDQDHKWWGYNYPKNLARQHLVKLMVPRLVYRLFASLDEEGDSCLDNVDVNGVFMREASDAPFLLALMNAPVMNWVWRRISKPFQHDYRSANKQFIAPLPVPPATPEQRAELGVRARRLQALHSRRRDVMALLDQQLASSQCTDDHRQESWLWEEVKSVEALKSEAPSELGARRKTAWAKVERARRLGEQLDGLDLMLRAGARLSVDYAEGELRLLIDHVPAIEGVAVDADEADFIRVQWRHAMRTCRVSEKFNGRALLRALLKLRSADHPSVRERVTEIDADLAELEAALAMAEREMNERVYSLHGLSEAEVCLVEAG